MTKGIKVEGQNRSLILAMGIVMPLISVFAVREKKPTSE